MSIAGSRELAPVRCRRDASGRGPSRPARSSALKAIQPFVLTSAASAVSAGEPDRAVGRGRRRPGGRRLEAISADVQQGSQPAGSISTGPRFASGCSLRSSRLSPPMIGASARRIRPIGRTGVPGIAILLHVAGEDHVLAVGRDVAAVDVPAVLAIDEPAVRAVRVGHPELGPAVAVVLRLARRAVREDDVPGRPGTSRACSNPAPLTAFAAPVATSIRATLQLVPNEFATPESHFPSGDQVSCWKNPLRGSVRTMRRLATSTIEMPLIVRQATCLPSGLQLAQGYSPARAEDRRASSRRWSEITSSPWVP